MEQIREIKNFVVTPHPAYSEKIKLHYVTLDGNTKNKWYHR